MKAFEVSFGAAVRPAEGESVSGDMWETMDWERGKLLAIVDGLGHGPRAAVAGHAFLNAVRPSASAPLADLFHEAHRALTKTRGAVAAIARFDTSRGEVEIGSIGNIVTLICRKDARPTHAVSVAGVLGSAFRRVRTETFSLAVGDFVVMCSDGVRGNLDVSKLDSSDAETLAREVVGTWSKHNDDAACAIGYAIAPGASARSSLAPTTRTIPVRMDSDAAGVATEARAFAAAMGFAPRATWEVSIAASELATNAIKFAGGGSLVLSKLTTPREALELVMSDQGEGIRDVEAAVVDRFSEGGLLGADRPRRPGQGLGVGLGSVHRMMDTVEVRSSSGNGTRIRALKYR